MKSDVHAAKSGSEACCNYLEKYLPLYMQRNLTHVLGYIFPQKDIQWKLNWFNEIRMPILTINLLNDDGKQNLSTKMEEM